MEIEAFSSILEKIRNKDILLPDFQRNFVWRDADRQSHLIASVLSKMPVGSILLLKGKAENFAYKQIGCSIRKTYSDLGISADKNILALLDGQQRLTVLATAFSDDVFVSAEKVDNLVSPSLKRRFFLKLPKRSQHKDSQDLFGVTKLYFPLVNSDTDEPSFIADDFEDLIDVIDFRVKDQVSFNPFLKEQLNKNELINYCTSGNYFRIPLFLLTGSNTAWLQKILNRITDNIINEILDEYSHQYENKISFISNILSKETVDLLEAPDKIEEAIEFEKALRNQADVWVGKMNSYLYSCLNRLQLNQIIVDNNKRSRAINIYKNLNEGGVALGTIELIMARYASISHDNYYDVLLSKISQKKSDYPVEIFNDILKNDTAIQNYIASDEYNVTQQFDCIKNKEIASDYIKAYLNVMSLYSNVHDFNTETITKENVSLIKKDKILDIPPKDLRDYCTPVCDALNEALFFLQARCGVRSISEINYKLILTVIAYVFMSSKNPIKYNYVEAWYWGSIFSGYLNSDQTTKTIDSIAMLIDAIKNNDSSKLKVLCNNIFKIPNFSNKEFLLLTEAYNTEQYPKEFISDVVCQFYLAQTYQCLFSDKEKLTPFTKNKLEKHHVIPLKAYLINHSELNKTSDDLRKDKKCFLNSPLNIIYITDKENLKISSRDLNDYQSDISSYSTKATLGFLGDMDMSTDDKCRNILSVRFDNFAGAVEKRIAMLIP